MIPILSWGKRSDKGKHYFMNRYKSLVNTEIQCYVVENLIYYVLYNLLRMTTVTSSNCDT